MKLLTKNTTNLLLLLAIFSALLLPTVASADVVVRGQDTVSVSSDQHVEENFYTLGKTVSVSGVVDGDWISIAEYIDADGIYQSDVLLLGGSVQVKGESNEDVRIVAVNTTISSVISGDAVIVADTVKISSDTTIDGDLLLFANTVVMDGSVAGNVLGKIGDLRIDGTVGGNVDISAIKLTVGENGDIAGDITYTSSQELVKAENANISGDTNYTYAGTSNLAWSDTASSLLIPVLAMVFAALMMFLLFPSRMHGLLVIAKIRFWFAALIGIGAIVFTPVLILAFLVSGLGSLVGLLLLAAYTLTLLTGVVLLGPFTGFLFSKYILKRDAFDVLTIALGMVLIYVVLLIPVVGLAWILLLLSVFFGIFILRLIAFRK